MLPFYRLVNHCNSYSYYDPAVNRGAASNSVWVTVDECFYEDLEM